MQRTALILGITGGYGEAMARELAGRGFALRALVRDRGRGERATSRVGVPVELVEGDVLDRGTLRAAAEGMAFIVHGVNGKYHQWDPFVLEVARAVADVAAAVGATIVFPGNVYNYAPQVAISESTPMSPPTRKGELRVELEGILREATQRGARLIVLRGGDFFGVGSDSAWLKTLLGSARSGGAIRYPGAPHLRHQWAYLPDFAYAQAELMLRADELPAAASFHFEGHVVTGDELIAASREALGDPSRKQAALPWWLLKLAGVALPLFRELVKMRYLWDEEVIMSGQRLRDTIGTPRCTPLPEAIRHELAAAA